MSLVGEARLAYIRKVYSFFGLAILAGVGGAVVSIQSGLVLAIAGSPFIAFILLMASIWFAGRHADNQTLAIPLLSLSAFISGLAASPLIFWVAGTQGIGAVYSAALLATTVFSGLTLYTWVSKKDFSYMGASLMIGLFLLIGVGLVNLFVASSTLALASSIVAVILFSGFILYDTSRILRQPHLVPPTLAALSLYLDFFNLFMSILQIIGLTGSSDD